MIRECTLDDIPFLLDTAYKFNSKHYDVPLCSSRLTDLLTKLITMPDGVAIRSDKGAIIGCLAQDPIRIWIALVELGWYSEGRDGIRLLRAFEQWGRDNDVNEIRMSTLEVNNGVSKLLARAGYSPMETSHRLLI